MSIIFWIVDYELFAVEFNENQYKEAISKSGKSYNHEKLWKLVGNNKPFNYYPRGRVEENKRREITIYCNHHVENRFLEELAEKFHITEFKVKYDFSEHYKCYLNR